MFLFALLCLPRAQSCVDKVGKLLLTPLFGCFWSAGEVAENCSTSVREISAFQRAAISVNETAAAQQFISISASLSAPGMLTQHFSLVGLFLEFWCCG